MQTVAIMGVGLIGASFGLALKKAGFAGRIVGVSSPAALRDALARGAIDETAALAEAAARADLVFLSQPICRILETLDALDPHLQPGALVTDAGSTKAEIVRRARRSIRRAQFLGGHPMAGKEKRGAAEGEADLFAGRTWVLTPVERGELETPAARGLAGWVRAIGAVPVVLGPEEHDRVVAATSHLPQLISTALAALLAERLNSPEHMKTAGPGLLDMTRLAASPYEIWGDIFRTNAAAVEEALSAYIARLEDLRARLGSDRLAAVFDQAARLRSIIR